MTSVTVASLYSVRLLQSGSVPMYIKERTIQFRPIMPMFYIYTPSNVESILLTTKITPRVGTHHIIRHITWHISRCIWAFHLSEALHLHFSLYAIATTGYGPSSCGTGTTSFHSARSLYKIHSSASASEDDILTTCASPNRILT